MASLSRRTTDEVESRSDYMSADTESSGSGTANQALFSEKVKQSQDAIQRGDFNSAVTHYTDAIQLDPVNHILYSNRSAAYIKLEQFEKALADALKAKELDPSWPKAFYREGIALQCLGRFADALAAFAAGLGLDSKNVQLLSGLVDAASKSPLKGRFLPTYQQLQTMKLDKNAFVIISVIGQDLLACNYHAASVVVLESALRIGTCSLKLRGSVFSALSSAHWGLKNSDQAIAYMQQDLSVAKSLGDGDGECRACGNLGSAFFSRGNYREALTNHRCQLKLAMKLKLRSTAANALSNLGHVYTAIGDYPNALASHKQCVLLVKQSSDKLWEAREIGNVGAVYTAMGDFTNALECHNEHLKIAQESGDKMEEARALSNLGSAHHYNRDYDKAINYHLKVLQVSQDLSDKTLEARAYAGLGHAARAQNNLSKARVYHEKQLDNALQTKDKAAEARACSNMGIVYHQLGEYEAALKLHKKHLSIAKNLTDRTSQGRAYGNIGNAYSALAQHDQAIKFHKQELAISKEVNDRHSEASTHGNLAVAYQALGMFEQALQHYNAHLNIARDLKDIASEARALSNVGNYYSVRGEFTQAIPFYMQYLQLSQELTDSEGEARACHCLGFAHYSLGNYREAIRYYEQDLALAKDLKDQLTMARAFCNLGLAYKSLGQYSQALEYQYNFLQITHSLKNVPGKFRAMGNIGDILINMQNMQEAVLLYNQQLKLAKQANDQSLEAAAYGALGIAHRLIGQYDKALGYHTQELNLRQELNDMRGECKAHGNLGNVHVSLGNYIQGYKCYEEQLERSKEVKDSSIEAQACGNLGITKMNMSQYEEAIGLFEQQLAMLEQVVGTRALLDKGRSFGNLGECYEQLGDFEESVKCHEQYLVIAQNTGSLVDQDKAYRGLGNAHRSMGNLQQALVCFEKRLVVTHEIDDSAHKGSAYGELGCLHSLLGNFDQAISCLEHQITLAKEQSDKTGESDACCGLGGVYQQMGEYERAINFHKKDLHIAQETSNLSAQCRAFGNLGLSYESQGDFQEALNHQEQHLSLAAEMNDRVAKTLAYSSLGRIHHALGNYPQASQYLRQGLQIAEQLGRREDEAKIRHRLGLALWADNDLDESQHQLYKAAELFENIRREAHVCSDYKLSLFDLQTASYQALQRVLVTLGRHEEALVVAERGRTRAFVDLLLERQTGGDGMYGAVDNAPVTIDQIMATVNRAKSTVIYYSIAAGYLYSWLLVPEKGMVKFHECSVNELEHSEADADNMSLASVSVSVLDQYVGQARECLGVETHLPSSGCSSRSSMRRGSGPSTSGVYSHSETDSYTSEIDDAWSQQLEEISGRLNSENDRTGFLRMVNRNHVFNSSNYSLSSLFSMSGSLNGFNLGANYKRTQPPSSAWSGKPPLGALYDLLISPMEDFLPNQNSNNPYKDLVLVLQGDLYLVPFAVLKGPKTNQYLYERFGLIVSPSLTALSDNNTTLRSNSGSSGALVVGNPHLPPSVKEQWHLTDLPSAEQEAVTVGEMMGVKPITGRSASKETVLRNVPNTEVIHVAAHVSWKLSSIVLSPSEYMKAADQFSLDDGHESGTESGGSGFDTPSLTEYLLTAADILNTKLQCKLVVLSSGHTDDRAARINSDGVVGLTRALLAAGAKCVLFSLWPVPSEASKLFMKYFYTSLLQGYSASRALSDSMKKVQAVKQFSHPSNWAGWVLVGSDVKLSSKVALMGQALCEIIQTTNRCREAMRVLLHLIEKSLQRIIQGEEKGMYTTQESIESKVDSIPGWKDLLTSVGFRFEPGTNGAPPVVFFPLSDPGERLTQCSTSLQALLAIPRNGLTPLAKLLSNYEAGEAIIQLLKDLLSRNEASSQLRMRVKLWRVNGCHEFLASLGFDLVDVGKDEVTIRTGKQSSKRIIQCAVQSLVVLFNTQEAPRLGLSGASSMESLNSSHSSSNTTTTSNFSKDSSTPQDSSTPPSSPHGKYYSPAGRLSSIRANHVGYNSKPRNPSGSLQKIKPLISVPRSPRSSKYTSSSVDDAFRFGGPGGRFRFGDDEAKVLGVDSDGTPTDDASSVSSSDTRRRTPTRFLVRHANNNSKQDGNYATSSPSDSEGAVSPLGRDKSRKVVGPAMRRISERTRTPTRTEQRDLQKPQARFIDKQGSRGENSRRRVVTESDSSEGSASSSHTMTATTVKDPSSLAFRIMMDTKTELQAVEKMQHLSVQHNKQETSRLRQEFAVNRPSSTPSPVNDRRSPKVHFEEDMASLRPTVAPKPKPRLELPLGALSNKKASTAAKGVRFNDVPIAIEAESESESLIETVRPPPGYENDNDKMEELTDNTPSPGTPLAPPPYDIAVNNRHTTLISHARQSEIQQPESVVEFLPKNSSHRRQLSDSREQLVDGSDYDDCTYYENGGFEVSDSEFEQHRANYVSVPSPVQQRVNHMSPVQQRANHMSPVQQRANHMSPVQQRANHMSPVQQRANHISVASPLPSTPNYVNNTVISRNKPVNPPLLTNGSHLPQQNLRPAIKPYPKQNHTFKPQINVNGLDLPPYPKGTHGVTSTDGVDYVNVYEHPPQTDERYVADIHNHYVDDLYPESNMNTYQQRPSRNANSPSNNTWGYNSNSSPANGALFYMTEGMKASEC